MLDLPGNLFPLVLQVHLVAQVAQESLVLPVLQIHQELQDQAVQMVLQVMLVTAVNHLLPVLLVVQDQQEHRD